MDHNIWWKISTALIFQKLTCPMYLVQLLFSLRLFQNLLSLLHSESELEEIPRRIQKNDCVFKELNDIIKVTEDFKEKIKRDQHTKENHPKH